MSAIIDDVTIPPNTIHHVIFSLGGGVIITGEAVNEQQRLEIDEILNSLQQNQTVEYDAVDRRGRRSHGAGNIIGIERNEEPVGTLMRIRYSISIQYIH